MAGQISISSSISSDLCESPSCKNQWWKGKRVRRSASTFGRLTPALEWWRHGGVEIIANEHGNRKASSYVAMNPTNGIVCETFPKQRLLVSIYVDLDANVEINLSTRSSRKVCEHELSKQIVFM
ncbi:hypothetical protein EJ110_NYTH05604 [Nymphaea thermarum]|nr:hypothetical protein EJ110_NYTH05604 [Nymphaea thermarum]